MTSSRAEPAPACPGGLGASWRVWVLLPAGPGLWGRGSAPPSLRAGTRTGRVGLGPGFSGPRIKAPGWDRLSRLPVFPTGTLKRAQWCQQTARNGTTSAGGGIYRDPAQGGVIRTGDPPSTLKSLGCNSSGRKLESPES